MPKLKKVIGAEKNISRCHSSEINSGDSHAKIGCLEDVWPVGAVSFLLPHGFWSHHLVSGLILPRTGLPLSKRPSNNSLIHFYKRCVSMALRFSIDQSYLFRIKEGPLKSWETKYREGYLYAATVSRCIHVQSPIQVLTWSWSEVNFGSELGWWPTEFG